jgi:hypothetical protein
MASLSLTGTGFKPRRSKGKPMANPLKPRVTAEQAWEVSRLRDAGRCVSCASTCSLRAVHGREVLVPLQEGKRRLCEDGH